MNIKIGDFSKMNDISIQTLRYYDKIGLLKPATIDSETGYRYYNVGQCSLVDTILYLRSLDFSLKDIRQFLTQSGSKVEQILLDKQEALIEERQRIDEQIFLMRHYTQAYQCFETNQELYQFAIETFPKRYAYQETIEGSIYAMDDDAYELCLRQFKKQMKNSNLNRMYFNRIGTIIQYDDFKNQQFFSNQMFVFVPKHLANVVFPKGDYAVTYVYEFESEKNTLSSFYKSIKDHGYKPSGDYYCEVVMEKPYLNLEQRSMFIRMQVPVGLI
ncbi:hypothetical protein AOC36_02950 [Erysipelothrix larvae]|uniref:HTH merR-type domain-containing protein n=1 Tax=Erysipelothrix larvae TaxID=1514105 RepID=A0A0X8GYZ6_9FIRM|nr:helix-turn-helix domain-containing protein [Erysipelothrix larvae]AMC92975.1 hypothetical protein AOC36_02950 [Erysipelothrix larvae]